MLRSGSNVVRAAARTLKPQRTSQWAQRFLSMSARRQAAGFRVSAGAVAGASVLTLGFSAVTAYALEPKVDWNKVKSDVKAILDEDDFDDGSIGPILIRLAWHASGTYDKNTKTGGSDGATMRFTPEAGHGANAGLAEARKRLEPVQAKHPGLSYSDLWILSSYVAIEEMGGPKIPFRAGRKDKPSGEWCTPDGRLPAADMGTKPGTIAHLRDIFYRQGFNDQEIVALSGAHALGRCHTTRLSDDANDFHQVQPALIVTVSAVHSQVRIHRALDQGTHHFLQRVFPPAGGNQVGQEGVEGTSAV